MGLKHSYTFDFATLIESAQKVVSFFCKTIYSFHKTGHKTIQKTNHYILLTNRKSCKLFRRNAVGGL